MTAEDSVHGCKEVSHQSNSSFLLFPLHILITGLMTPSGTEQQRSEPVVFTLEMNEKCLLGHINLSGEQPELPVRGIIVKKPEILRKGDYGSSVIFIERVPIPCISTWFFILQFFPRAEPSVYLYGR